MRFPPWWGSGYFLELHIITSTRPELAQYGRNHACAQGYCIYHTQQGRGGGWGGGIHYMELHYLNMHSLQAGVNKNLPASLKYLQAFSSQ